MGWKIFVKAIRLVFDNLNDALRISALLYFVPTAILYGLTYAMVPRTAGKADPAALAAFVGPSAILSLIEVVAFVWIAVAWHRFVLLDERPDGWLPRFNGPRMLGYVGYSLLLALISIPILIVGALVIAALTLGGPLLIAVGVLVMVSAALIVGYRLALVLPASSIEKPLRLGQAWEATRGANGTIVVLALVSALAAVLLDLPGMAMTGPLALLGLVWRLVMGWLELVVGVSILTTLYGVFIEHRSAG